jgi:hypothetical protein
MKDLGSRQLSAAYAHLARLLSQDRSVGVACALSEGVWGIDECSS